MHTGSMALAVRSSGALVRAALLFMGASVFAYLFGVFVHEIGHYVASLALGVPEPGSCSIRSICRKTSTAGISARPWVRRCGALSVGRRGRSSIWRWG